MTAKPARRKAPAIERVESVMSRRSRRSTLAAARSSGARGGIGRHSPKITPDLIPHSLFHTGAWLLPVERPDWYYFSKRRNVNTIANDKFLKSVDKPIRPLVRWLHERGIKTTPSCSGHHMAERSLEGIYEDLRNDTHEIRDGGLRLKNIETGKILLYQNSNYSLPWTRRDFLRKAVVYQRRGVLGMRLGNRKTMKEQIHKMKIPGVRVRERDGILFVFADNNTGDNRYAWKEVTKTVRKIIEPNRRT